MKGRPSPVVAINPAQTPGMLVTPASAFCGFFLRRQGADCQALQQRRRRSCSPGTNGKAAVTMASDYEGRSQGIRCGHPGAHFYRERPDQRRRDEHDRSSRRVPGAPRLVEYYDPRSVRPAPSMRSRSRGRRQLRPAAMSASTAASRAQGVTVEGELRGGRVRRADPVRRNKADGLVVLAHRQWLPDARDWRPAAVLASLHQAGTCIFFFFSSPR